MSGSHWAIQEIFNVLRDWDPSYFGEANWQVAAHQAKRGCVLPHMGGALVSPPNPSLLQE